MREVTLAYGLNLLNLGLVEKLYSDGLDSDEYIYCKDRAFYYEDNCMIGDSYFRTLTTLFELEWPLNHKFYVKEDFTDNKCVEFQYYIDEMKKYGCYVLLKDSIKMLGVTEDNKYCIVRDGKKKVLGKDYKEAVREYFDSAKCQNCIFL